MAKRGIKRKRKVADPSKKDGHPEVEWTWEPNRFQYVIPEDEDTPVTNQKQEGTCQKWATTDMASIVLRREFPGLVTSPQILIDRNPDLRDLIDICIDFDKGLESVHDYPVVRVPKNVGKWNEALYETSRRERFRLQNLVYCTDLNEMIARILGMFCDGGYRYPCVCVMRLGELFDGEVARSHALGLLPPFRHSTPVPEDKHEAAKSHGVPHAMLITGVNTTSQDPNDHYCVVKNTYGKSWGYNGRSRVAFEVFEYVLFPVQKEKDEREKEERKKEERKRKKMEKERKIVEERPEGGDDGCDAVGGISCKNGMEEKSKGVDNGGGDDGGKRTKKRPQEKSDGRDDGADKERKKEQEKPWGEGGGSLAGVLGAGVGVQFAE